MRVTVIAVGTRGDVHPLIALAAGLHKAGHAVRFATESIFAKPVLDAGLEFYQLSGNSERFHAGPAGVAFRESLDRSPWQFRKFWKSFVAIGFRRHLQEVVVPCQNAEAIVSLPYLNIAASLGEKFEVPAFVAGMIPVPAFPTREFPYPFHSKAAAETDPERVLRTWRRSIPLVRISDESVQEWRRSTLGLPVQTWSESQHATRSIPHLLGFSPLVIPKPADWEGEQSITGSWFLPSQAGYTPPKQLGEFLSAGEPPVLIGFGSHIGRNPERLTRTVIDALAMAGRRGLLVAGWGALGGIELPESVLCISGAPYEWLLPRMMGAVHHGGSGTVGACLRAGVPQVITPFGYDQAFWGHRIARLGVGSLPIDAATMTADALAAAIRSITTDPAIVARAREVGVAVSAERGVEDAVAAIEAWVARRNVPCAIS